MSFYGHDVVLEAANTMAAGLSHPEKGKTLRESLRVFLADIEQLPPGASERNQCARIVAEALSLAHGVGAGDISMVTRGLDSRGRKPPHRG